MGRTLALLYGIVSYAAFLAAFCYSIGFVEGVVVPKAINDGPVGETVPSILLNVVLLGLFAIQHTIMARPAFKNWWCRLVPRPIERSTFVLVASALLALMMWQWRPLPEVVWQLDAPLPRNAVLALSFGGWLLVLYATFVIDHFDLFGLRQAWFHFRNVEYHHPPFVERTIYKVVRHPLMLGFLIAFWAAPTMSQGRLLFAVVTTAYILVAVRIEERDLVAMLGESYKDYRRRTPRLFPFLPIGRVRS